jgi:cyclopropane-fatty-acyl-phospholipid synthase
LEELIYRLLKNKINQKVTKVLNFTNVVDAIKLKLKRNKYDAFEVGTQHYDIGNDLYKIMLGETLAYSCGYFKDTDNLDEAQYAKFELICKKLQLQKGETLLDIGCGWGGLMKYAAKNYGVKVVGLTVSKEQKKHIEESKDGLDITVHLEDYKQMTPSSFENVGIKKFDKIVSVGMFEHVNRENYDFFLRFVDLYLIDGGLFLLHTIGDNQTNNDIEPWIAKYIFPNSKLPSVLEVIKASEDKFILEDFHNFGFYYHLTLQKWWQNFNAAWESELKAKYDKNNFYRMWKYYLVSCSAGFKARHIQLWQIVYTKNPNSGYDSLR